LAGRPTLTTSASNETSLIQWANIDKKAIVLTADVGPQGLNEAADREKGIPISEAFQGTQIGSFLVMAPSAPEIAQFIRGTYGTHL
jgi:hypothetical protein